ncbi:Protein argonaute-2 [Cichlidogyrus casuarinus]|uniref:Protein argonaute-2 n=1 Tax=Cichlidogyrus casuarinus TaxID=1844966 RepID=A0ABD2PV99_9PLAT
MSSYNNAGRGNQQASRGGRGASMGGQGPPRGGYAGGPFAARGATMGGQGPPRGGYAGGPFAGRGATMTGQGPPRGGFGGRGAPMGGQGPPRGGRGGGGRGGRGGGPERPAPGNLQPPKVTTTLSKLSLTGNKLQLVKRPEPNSTDPVVKIRVNCWDISFAELEAIMYDLELVSVTPVSAPERVLKIPTRDLSRFNALIVKELPKDCVFDGGRIVYSVQPLEGITTVDTVRELVTSQLEAREDLKITYKIREVQRVSTSNLSRFVTSAHGSQLNMPQEAIRLIDCVFRTFASADLINPKGNAFYYPKPEKIVADKLFHIHRGFITSCRPQWKVRINVDMTCKAFFASGNLADVLYEKYGDGMIQQRTYSAIEADIKGLRVEAGFYKNTKNGKAYKKRLTICGVSQQPCNKIVIADINKTVDQYFKEHHNIVLKYANLPCASMSTKRDVFIPFELLEVLPHQQATASKADLAAEIVRCAAVRPQDRFRTLYDYVKAMRTK